MKKIVQFGLMFCVFLTYSQNKKHEIINFKQFRDSSFTYKLLAKDSLKCSYLNLNFSQLESSKTIDSSSHGIITLQKYKLDDISKIFYYKHNFANTNILIKDRDAVEIYGIKYNIDSLFYGRKFNRKPYIFSTLVNVSKFNFKNSNYIAFFIQDLSNPVSLPNTLILLFDVSDIENITYIKVGFQASEDLKCFNDFDDDGILDYADWKQGYDFQKKIYRYKLNKHKKFVLQKKDFITLEEDASGYYINFKKSNWSYWRINN